MKIAITNPKSSKFTLFVIETIESGSGYSSYGESYTLEPGERVRILIDDDHGAKIEKLGRDDGIEPR